MGELQRDVYKRQVYCLLGAEDTVTRIAQTRNDVAVVVQLLVNAGNEDLNVRMSLLNLSLIHI